MQEKIVIYQVCFTRTFSLSNPGMMYQVGVIFSRSVPYEQSNLSFRYCVYADFVPADLGTLFLSPPHSNSGSLGLAEVNFSPLNTN